MSKPVTTNIYERLIAESKQRQKWRFCYMLVAIFAAALLIPACLHNLGVF